MEAWVNTTSGTTNQAVVGYGPTSTDEAFIVSLSAGAINVDGYNDYLSFPTPRPVNDGHWHMITVSYDGTTVIVYLDGQQVGSASFAGTVNTLDPSGLSLAYFPGYNALNGDVADVAVSVRAHPGRDHRPLRRLRLQPPHRGHERQRVLRRIPTGRT